MSPDREPAGKVVAQIGVDATSMRDSVAGFIEILDESRLAGWAWCRTRPEMPVEVEIRLDDRVVQRARADRFRQDLARAGIGDGKHGFNVVFDEPVPQDQKSRLAAFVICGPSGPYVPLPRRTGLPSSRAPEAVGAAGEQQVIDPNSRPLLTAVSDLQKSIDERLGAVVASMRSALTRLAADGKATTQSLEARVSELRAVQDSLSQQISTLEVFQARIDAALGALESAKEHDPGRTNGRWLTIVVSALALVSSASLVLGLISVFG
jgi:hypothetical protein